MSVNGGLGEFRDPYFEFRAQVSKAIKDGKDDVVFQQIRDARFTDLKGRIQIVWSIVDENRATLGDAHYADLSKRLNKEEAYEKFSGELEAALKATGGRSYLGVLKMVTDSKFYTLNERIDLAKRFIQDQMDFTGGITDPQQSALEKLAQLSEEATGVVPKKVDVPKPGLIQRLFGKSAAAGHAEPEMKGKGAAAAAPKGASAAAASASPAKPKPTAERDAKAAGAAAGGVDFRLVSKSAAPKPISLTKPAGKPAAAPPAAAPKPPAGVVLREGDGRIRVPESIALTLAVIAGKKNAKEATAEADLKEDYDIPRVNIARDGRVHATFYDNFKAGDMDKIVKALGTVKHQLQKVEFTDDSDRRIISYFLDIAKGDVDKLLNAIGLSTDEFRKQLEAGPAPKKPAAAPAGAAAADDERDVKRAAAGGPPGGPPVDSSGSLSSSSINVGSAPGLLLKDEAGKTRVKDSLAARMAVLSGKEQRGGRVIDAQADLRYFDVPDFYKNSDGSLSFSFETSYGDENIKRIMDLLGPLATKENSGGSQSVDIDQTIVPEYNVITISKDKIDQFLHRIGMDTDEIINGLDKLSK